MVLNSVLGRVVWGILISLLLHGQGLKRYSKQKKGRQARQLNSPPAKWWIVRVFSSRILRLNGYCAGKSSNENPQKSCFSHHITTTIYIQTSVNSRCKEWYSTHFFISTWQTTQKTRGGWLKPSNWYKVGPKTSYKWSSPISTRLYTPENWQDIGKSPCSIENTSSNGGFSIGMWVFLGGNPSETQLFSEIYRGFYITLLITISSREPTTLVGKKHVGKSRWLSAVHWELLEDRSLTADYRPLLWWKQWFRHGFC